MAKMISTVVLITIVITALVGMFNGLVSLAHVRGGNRELAKAVFMGRFCPREVFTEDGWRYRRRGMWAANTAIILLLVWALLLH
jgi:hypothetical protein